MAFRFTLETVLWLRQIAEQREERMLEGILHAMTQQRQSLADLAASRQRVLAEREAALRAQTSAAELLLLQGQKQALAEQEAADRKQLAHLEEQRQAQMKIYETAHRNRELLSRMREEQMELFKREQVRKEQMRMDDIFSSRRT